MKTLLSWGTTHRVAAAVGGQLGIDQIEAELLPEQKLSRIREVLARKHVVAMVGDGDGINDAPALAVASVGIAMGFGTDVAQ